MGVLCPLRGETPDVGTPDAAIKPFSMGEMRTMKYRTRFAGEEAKLLYYGNGDNVLATAAESSDGSPMSTLKRNRPSTGIRVNFRDPSG